MTKEEYLRKVAEMQTDISAIKQEGMDDTKTCKNCIHQEVCYRYSYGLPENYADKCGDYLLQKSGKWIERDKRIHYSYWERYKCSRCGHYGDNDYKFCPNCGADMRVKAVEE